MVTRVWLKLLLCSGLVVFASCSHEFPDTPYPRIETLEATDVTELGATFHAKIHMMGGESIVNHGFVWADQPRFYVSEADRIDLGPVSNAEVIDAHAESTFSAGTTYYVMAFVQTESYVVYGIAVPFAP